MPKSVCPLFVQAARRAAPGPGLGPGGSEVRSEQTKAKEALADEAGHTGQDRDTK